MEEELQGHVGFDLFDPVDNEHLIEYNSDKYFTPASNTKILTLYASYAVLGDSIPALYFQESADSLIIWGSGDPSFLYEYVPESPAYNFLKSSEREIYYSDANYFDQGFGPGWAWDDYAYSFSSEKSALPVYGNRLHFKKEAKSIYPELMPDPLKPLFYLGDSAEVSRIDRDYSSNTFYYYPGKKGLIDKSYPFKYSATLICEILSDTLDTKVRYVNQALPANKEVLYNPNADSLYSVMMKASDNFIAEQLLLTVAGVVSDSLKSEIALRYITNEYFSEMPDKPIWKDGSGLSRYNLFTPRSIVWLWNELLKMRSEEKLLPVLASGGVSGTLKNYYKAEKPYIFGKTGTLSNNHNLSGFLITRKGKILIFSFMNNSYPGYSLPVKRKMEKILREIHLKY